MQIDPVEKRHLLENKRIILPPSLAQTIEDRIRELGGAPDEHLSGPRRTPGMTAAAQAVGISVGHMSNIAAGRRAPSPVVAEAIIMELGLDRVTVAELRELAARTAKALAGR